MPDDTQPPVDSTGQPPAGESTPPSDPSAAFKQGAGVQPQDPWYKGVVSDDLLQDDKVRSFADKYKSLEEALKGAGHLATKIGEKGVRVPGEDADPNEVSQFYQALGRPEEPTGYSWEKPEDVPIDEETFEQARTALHAAGLSDSQFAKVMDFYTGQTQQQMEAAQKQQEQALDKTLETLREQWGADFDKKMSATNHLINQQGWGEMLSRTGLYADPEVINMLASVATSVGEDTLSGPGMGVISAEQEMKNLKQSDAYRDKNHPDHRMVKERILSLYPKA